MSITIWTKASARRKRLLSIAAVLVVALVITAVGTLIPVDKQQANQIDKDINQTRTTLGDQGILTQYIFGNNFLICLLMFVPVIGPLLGLFIMFNTGVAISAIATAEGFPSSLAYISLFLTPHFWLEYAAYSTAMAASVWLFWRLITRRGLREVRVTCIFISICAVLLVAAAFVETWLISILG